MLHPATTAAGAGAAATTTTATAALHHHHHLGGGGGGSSGNPLSANTTPAQLLPPAMGDDLAHLIDSPALQLLA